MPTLVIRHPDGTQTEETLEAELSIGRAEGNDLRLTEGGVSRKHARFFVENGEVLVEDVGSANGTTVDGARIDGPTPVAVGSVVELGDYEVRLKEEARPKRGAAPAKTKAPGGKSTGVVPVMKPGGPAALAKRTKPNRSSTPQLRGLSGAVNGQSFPLKGTMVVGRVAEADLQVEDDSVSRKHAELEVKGREVVLRDLGSANGTTINGVPITSDTALTVGDIIQFGVVELIFESSAGSGSRAPVSRTPELAVSPRRAPVRRDRSRGDDAGDFEPTSAKVPGSQKRLVIIGGAVAVFLLVLVGAKAVIGPSAGPGVKPGGSQPILAAGGAQKPAVTQAEQLEEALSACRQYSALDSATGPNWARAEEACKVAIELEPIHKEGNELMKRIQLNRVCEENLKQAKTLVSANRAEESLELFAKIRPECGYFLKALAAAKAPVEDVKKATGIECKQYAANGKWENAVKRCELYTRLACQLMDKDERQPPPMMKVKLDGPLTHNDWRPKDPLYLNFLKARERVAPNDGVWSCPEIPVFRPPQAGEDPAKRAKDEFMKRSPDPDMGHALELYFDGKFQEMLVPLQRIQDSMQKSKLHEQARELSRNMTSAANQYKSGSTELGNDKPEKAEEPFRNALAIDEKLVMGEAVGNNETLRRELDRRKSFVRKNVLEEMSRSTYQKGKGFADRQDWRQACRVWKLGMSFSKSDTDLLRAVTNKCTGRAAEFFKTANTCEELKAVLEYAVDGDTYKEKATAAMAEMKCQE